MKCALMVLALLIPLVLWFSLLLCMPDHLGGSIAATFRYKTELIRDTPGPRILFAGGSSSPYGTVCADVEEALGRSAICVGSTAYLGLPLYLNLLTEYCRPGDIVVLAPEHILLQGESINYALVWEALGTQAAAWRCLPPSYLPGLFCSSVSHARIKYGRLSQPAQDYHSDFGPLGDVVTFRESLLESGYNTQDMVSLSAGNLYMENLERINRFARTMESRDVTVLFAFAPLDRLAVESNEAQLQEFEQVIRETLTVPVILDLETALMEGRLFYDSNNHLTTEGAAINTQNLIFGIRPYLSEE